MRIEELTNKTDERQYRMILSCPKHKTEEIMANPKMLEGKALLFIGNYDGLATNRLCGRIVEYLPSEDRWKVSDMRLYDMDRTEFWHHFTKSEFKSCFRPFYEAEGFIVEL